MRRTLRFLATMLVLAAMLLAMAAPVMAEEKEEITLTVAWGALESTIYDQWMETFFTPYMEANPNVTINFIAQNAIQDTVRVQIGVGAGPDIFMADCFDLADYAESGRILNMDKYAEQYGWYDRFLDWAMSSCEYDGVLYGVPNSADVTGLYYNADMLKELNLELPTNREEYVAALQAAVDAGYTGISLGISDGALNAQWIIDHYMTCVLGKEGIEKLFTGELKFTDPEVSEVFAQLKADWDAGFINNKLSGAITGEEGRAIFVNGNALFNPEGCWLSNGCVPPDTWTFDWEFVAWPSMKEGIPAAGGTGLGDMFLVNAATKYPDVCADLLNFMFADQERLANGVAKGMNIPCVEMGLEDFPEGTSQDVIDTVIAFSEISALDSVSYCPWSGYPADTNIWLYENISKLWYDEFTLDQFLAGAQEVLEKDLAEGFTFVAY